MEAFTRLDAVAAPLPVANVDTDMLVPARFLKTVSRSGLAKALFNTQRFDEAGVERADFILNRAPWRAARILVGGDNFGCGSSREHAPWALLDYGIRCIIAPGFADIFHTNCFKNGILPVTLAAGTVARLMTLVGDPARARLVVGLETQTIETENGERIGFAIDPVRRRRLLGGVDDIAVSLEHRQAIVEYERRRTVDAPWISAIPADFLTA